MMASAYPDTRRGEGGRGYRYSYEWVDKIYIDIHGFNGCRGVDAG